MHRIDVDRLMSIAAEAFARHGFTGVGMREVSRECGVSLPTLYYYFGSKDKLFEAVCRERYEKALQQVRGSLDFGAASLESRMESLAGRLFDLLTGDQTLFLLLRRDLIQGSLSQNEFRSSVQYEGLLQIFTRLLSSHFEEERAERLAFTVASLIFGYCELATVTATDAEQQQRRRADLMAALRTLLRKSA